MINTYSQRLLLWAAVLGGFAVAFGALGAHALKQVLDAQKLASFETAVRYQMYHALLLTALAALVRTGPVGKWLKMGASLIQAGVLCFSGSIYLLVFGLIGGPLALITPLGGVLMIAGWVMLAVQALQKREE